MQTLTGILTSNRNVVMQYELVLMLGAFLISAVCLKDKRRLCAAWGGIFLFFIYIHRILLPFIVSGIYLTAICGIVCVIVSLKPAAFTAPYAYLRRKLSFYTERSRLPFTAVILMILLIQLCRINIAIDYDSIRYGLRSDILLTSGEGIVGFFTNTGLVNGVYTYPKGYELLTRPLYFGNTYGYVLCVNIWMLIAVLLLCGEIVRAVFDSEQAESSAAMLAALIPGITNMSITAKSDLSTLVCQLGFILCAVLYLSHRSREIRGRSSDRRMADGRSAAGIYDKGSSIITDSRRSDNRSAVMDDAALTGIGAGLLILSLSFKQTAFVFSTVIGLAALMYFAAKRIIPYINGAGIRAALLCVIYTCIITLRTFLISGYPVTGVFSGIFDAMGFELKYPFAGISLFSDDGMVFKDKLIQLFRRIFKMIFCPTGKDMDHVFMAWGGIVFIVTLIIAVIFAWRAVKKAAELEDLNTVNGEGVRISGAAFAFIRFMWIVTGLISLAALYCVYQVDGNYFMLMYAMTAVLAMLIFYSGAAYELGSLGRGMRRIFSQKYNAAAVCIAAVMIYVTAFTGWSGAVGFTDIDLINRGYYNHKAEYCYEPAWADDARVVAFADEHECYRMNGRLESWVDIDGSGGNVYLTDTKLNIFKEYLSFADIDYIYADLYFISDKENSRHERAGVLFGYLLEDGCFEDIYLIENTPNRIVARIDKDRMAVGWEVPQSSELKERIARQTAWFESIKQ